jgi:hypothetical protein
MARMIGLILVLFSIYLSAQNTVREVDEITYNQFVKGNWQSLAKTGSKAAKQGLDFYYLNVRTGIAMMQLQRYHSAEKFLTKAAKQNSNDYVNEQLMWAQSFSGNDFEANKTFKKLSEETQQQSGFKTTRPLEFVYVEGGAKFSDKTAIVGNSAYAQLLLKHNITPGFHLLHGYTFLNRPTPSGTLYQHQYLIAPSFHVKNGWAFEASILGMSYHTTVSLDSVRIIDAQSQDTIPAGIRKFVVEGRRNTNYSGNYTQFGGYFQAGFSKRFYHFALKSSVGFFVEQRHPNYSKTVADVGIRRIYVNDVFVGSDSLLPPSTTSVDSFEIYYQGQLNIDAAYTFPFWQERITIGAKFFMPFTKSKVYATASPYLSVRVAKRAWLSAVYLYKGSYFLIDNGGTLLFNAFDVIHARTSLTATVAAAKIVTVYATFMHENLTDNFSKNRYNLYSAFAGLKFNLP